MNWSKEVPSCLLRRSLHATALAAFTAALGFGPAYAETVDQPSLSPGFATLVETAPDIVGQPLENEHPGDVEGSTIVRTTTGLLYWQPDAAPSWTDGHNRFTLDTARQFVRWVGELIKPPAPVFSLGAGANLAFGSGDWIDRRIYCIEGIESQHGRLMGPNPTGIWNANLQRYEHAAGYLGWLGSTAAVWGAQIGNRMSEWAAARRMIVALPEYSLRTQFYGVGAGLC